MTLQSEIQVHPEKGRNDFEVLEESIGVETNEEEVLHQIAPNSIDKMTSYVQIRDENYIIDLESGLPSPVSEEEDHEGASEGGDQESDSERENESQQSSEIRKRLFLYAKKAKPYLVRLLILFCMFLVGLLVYLVYDIYMNNFKNIPTSTYYNQGDVPTYRLTFIGDSLIHRPFKEFDLGGRLQRQFKTINLNITENAESGQIISECYDNIENDVPKGSADMVILYWDTDVSDYDECEMTFEEVVLKREYYKSNLTAVIESVKAAGVSKIAIAGPTILGEGPFLHKHFTVSQKNKKSMLNDYRQINMDIAQELGVDYIDMRKAYLKALPDYWFPTAFYLTLDGEHPNDRGTGVIVDKFAKQISDWTGAAVK